MSRVQSPEVEFARRGFAQPAVAARRWTAWPEETRERIDLGIFADVGDRSRALEVLDQLRETDVFDDLTADPDWLDRVLKVAGASSALAQSLAKDPALVRLLAEPPVERDAEGWRAFFAERVPIVDDVAQTEPDELRRANRAALILIAARDLTAEDPSELVESISLELAHVADQVLETALALARGEVPEWRDVRLAVLALGKTGAQELNYLSDVDVIHLAEPATEHVPTDRAIAIATRLAAAQTRICSAHTKAGTIWTLDAGLRPEGKAGPLVRTLDSCRTYYTKWAKNWEFQAMLKARPAAGDLELGQAFVDMVAPLVWDAGHREGFLPEMRAMRDRVISLIPKAQAEREIKLTAGGLRDTEFSVQLLQLVHGRADDRLHVRGTLPALRALVDAGYIGREDGTRMGEHYRFQRVLEHRAQLANLRRTHLVPDDERTLAEFARTMYVDDVEAQFRASRREVQRLRQRIFFSPLLDAVANVPRESLLSADAAKERTRALGFLDPRTALAHIQALTEGTSRSAEIRRQLMPAMLEWIADGPNPDFGLLSFRQLSEALGETSWYLRAMRDEGWMAKRLATVASTSRFAVELLKRAPESVRLLASDDELQPRDAEQLVEAMRRAAARQEEPDEAAASARALRRSELCRIAVMDVLGRVDIATSGRALSDLADAAVETALDIARREIDAPALAVVALGRWGGQEMGYSSDLDCQVVVPDDTDHDGLEAATKLWRRVVAILGKPGPDPALVIDTDLRPGGKGGPQVRTLGSALRHYTEQGATWERQMLLRARPAAGDRGLVEQLLDGVADFRFPAELGETEVREIRRLKSRMEKERIPRGVDRHRHLKLGPGGLSDVEWTVQLTQLRHAHTHPELRVTGTLEALDAARSLGLLADDDARALEDAWRNASLVRDAIMLVRGRAADAIPTDTRELAAIAALLGHDGPVTQLGERTRRLARLATAVVDREFWGE